MSMTRPVKSLAHETLHRGGQWWPRWAGGMLPRAQAKARALGSLTPPKLLIGYLGPPTRFNRNEGLKP
jgi:hypothetical protein